MKSTKKLSNPPPKKSDHPSIVPLVMSDLRDRYEKGLKEYGTPLKPFNGRDALVDLYEELLDACCYLRQAIYELDNKRK